MTIKKYAIHLHVKAPISLASRVQAAAEAFENDKIGCEAFQARIDEIINSTVIIENIKED